MPDSTKNDNPATPTVVAPSDVKNKSQDLVRATNQGVEKAGDEAANRVKGVRNERFNTTDAVLGADEKHGINVKKAQAASFGEEYDPKSDPEVTPPDVTPSPSQNQNNLIHPEGDEYTNPHASKNYLGQPI